MSLPLEEMDQDLLAMYIRWFGHSVEKGVRNDKREGRGHSKPALVRAALDEWYRRKYPQREFILWAEDNLQDYMRWAETGEIQSHPVEHSQLFNPHSPVFDVLLKRSSVRFWQPIPVEEAKIHEILRAATHAPSSCNRQTWKLYVHRNPNLGGDSKLRSVSNTNLQERAPVTIFITIDIRLYPEKWAPAEDAGIVGQQMALAATALGLGGCLMYGGDDDAQDEWCKRYHIPPYRRMYLMFLFGYPAEHTVTEKRAHPDDIAVTVPTGI
ncbi:MAG: nitroreductase family protein [Acidobacteriia bacterium]|nr:nitroreductase family protein [Terriglobia bacterium]